jgi:malonyl-CoA O-methyltransferase
MFSCFGPDTLRELRALYAEQGWPPPVQDFTDMHDWGDQLAMAGFADPVMDMEHITLSFDTPARLLAELRGLGRNLHPQRFGGLRAPRGGGAWRRAGPTAAGDAGAPLELTFEIIYGHALRPSAQRGAPREGLTVHRTRASLRESSAPVRKP